MSSEPLTPPSPPEVIETRRIRLAALRPEDGAALAALVQLNRDRLGDSFPASVSALTDSAAGERYVASKASEWSARHGFWFGIWERSSATLIGQIQIKNVDWSIRKAELAYWLDRAFEGRGLVAEAIAELLAIAFSALALRKLFLRAIPTNQRSAAVARRFGFTREGTLRQEFRTLAGAWVDLDYFGLLSAEYTAAPGATSPGP